MRELTARYRDRIDPDLGLYLTDNILDMKYFTTLLPALRDSGLGVSVFCETKANLNKDQVRMLADSGVREGQPGIESLHSSLLRLMRKGCTALQNIQLLKWCQEFGIKPHYNLLNRPGTPSLVATVGDLAQRGWNRRRASRPQPREPPLRRVALHVNVLPRDIGPRRETRLGSSMLPFAPAATGL